MAVTVTMAMLMPQHLHQQTTESTMTWSEAALYVVAHKEAALAATSWIAMRVCLKWFGVAKSQQQLLRARLNLPGPPQC
jgi:hypothetical protein